MHDTLLLEGCLRDLAKWRSQSLATAMLGLDGSRVQTGPFAGMEYAASATEGSLSARLLGCYESELHPHIEAFAQAGLRHVLDIGCAEGYYAVGFARLMPAARVHAFDLNPTAREACRALAQANGVAVEIGSEFRGEDFAAYPPQTLVFVDIEGGERDLLDPVRYPALRRLPIIVETHPTAPGGAGVTELLTERFRATHDIVRVDHAPRVPQTPEWLQKLGHLDLLLAAWEWRGAATPWLVMHPRVEP